MKRILFPLVSLLVLTMLLPGCSKEEKSTVVDWEGYEYKTKLYGQNWWMVENMRTTRTKDGQNIWVSSDEDKFSYTTPYCYFYDDNNKVYFKERGCLYNWAAANEVCPEGWHLPTVADYEALEQYISSVDKYCYKGNRKSIAKAMAANKGWLVSYDVGTPGCNSMTNNASGFYAYAVGHYWHGSENSFFETAEESSIWLADEYDGNYAESFSLYNDKDSVIRRTCDKSAGFSVRCVRSSGGGPDPGDDEPEDNPWGMPVGK